LGALILLVIDLWEHYVASNSVEFTATGADIVANTDAGNLTITTVNPPTAVPLVGGVLQVPDNEYWFVQELAAVGTFNAVAGGGARVWPLVALGPFTLAAGIARLTAMTGYDTSSTIIRSQRIAWTDPVWISPGGRIFAHHGGILLSVGGTLGWGLTGRIARLRI